MKYYLLILLSIILFSCGKEKVVQLPEISHSEITEISDVSAAYLFYDETQKDSVELNRKNLISTTNWLVNVDKQLTLKQVIPHIKFLQDKKKNAGHKNEHAKNYFTCNDTSRVNLGFVEFTDIVYYNDGSGYNTESYSCYVNLAVLSLNDIRIITSENKVLQTDKASLQKTIINLVGLNKCLIFLEFDNNITFQEYITIKSIISKIDIENVIISNHEFIF